MRTLQTPGLKSSRNETGAENANNNDASHTSDGVDLSAQPSYTREYDALLTLEEAVDR